MYAGADVFVSPTYSEGFSNTVLEAMACGLAVVSCETVGVVDAIRDGENGLLVHPGDLPALAAAIDRVLDDAALRARLTGVALAEVRERYSWPGLAGAIVGAYDRVRAGGGSAAGVADVFSDPPVDPGCRFRAAPHLL